MNTRLIRNIGICAHIDAGKTTLTERILYYTGSNYKLGEVHDGNATMDWMDQEKERGITINSASTSVYWFLKESKEKYRINIIDTPGHVDFTAEVERSMRVLDGVCLVLCSVGGIQPQTETVWRQINRYKVPRICFVNKMDRVGSDFNKVCYELKDKLGGNPVILNIPVLKKGIFIGVYDILKLKYFSFKGKYGEKVLTSDIPVGDYEYVYKKRVNLVENLIKNNDILIDKYLEDKLSFSDIISLIRKKTISCDIVPVVCGSAFKNKGVQCLLDYILHLLPSPTEKKIYYLKGNNSSKILLDKKENRFSSIVFKVINDPYSGRISFTRIYSGKVKSGDIILNSSKCKKEKISRIISYNVNKKTDVNTASIGDIVAFVGLKTTCTGDTLCNNDLNIVFESIKFPEPVISFSVFSDKSSDYERMLNALKKNAIEDPTISVGSNSDTGDLIVSGMGELHIDVFLERVRRETGICISKRDPKVSYRETISNSYLNSTGKYIRQSGGRGQYGHVEINIYPRKIGKGFKFVNLIRSGVIPREYIKPIEKSIKNCCKYGYIYGSPIVDIKVELIFGSYHEVDSNENAFKIAASIAFRNAFYKAKPILLEPIMLVSIDCPEEFLGNIISDISTRRGEIISTKKLLGSYTIKANIPMYNMFDYTTCIRSKTKGRSTYTMSFGFYKRVPDILFNKLVTV
ncbi:elongation factor G [Candidatus Vidania fulgoroideae]|uniref:Elongation factor G n=1 Tax=Candidatus Vidania fulgoroideorum TaxID=881286 RepID=A0A975AEK2_9PROT|nr:elongation factor G [Candidatus Vidania fulgoroideae]